jgi:hypothetical protein
MLVEIGVSESSERYSSSGTSLGAVSGQLAEAVVTLRQAVGEKSQRDNSWLAP